MYTEEKNDGDGITKQLKEIGILKPSHKLDIAKAIRQIIKIHQKKYGNNDNNDGKQVYQV